MTAVLDHDPAGPIEPAAALVARPRPSVAVARPRPTVVVARRRARPVPAPAVAVLQPDEDLAAHALDPASGVARRLESLDAEWQVLHRVPTVRGLLDHVLVGPAGVFTVATCSVPRASVWVYGDVFDVDGTNRPDIGAARACAGDAAALLAARVGERVPTRGIVAVLGAHRGFAVSAQPADGLVHVTTRMGLPGYLRSLPRVLDPVSIAVIHDAARHLATWQPTSVMWQQFG